MSTTSKSGFDRIFYITNLTLIAIQQLRQDVISLFKVAHKPNTAENRVKSLVNCGFLLT